MYIPLFTLEEVFLDKDTALPMAGGVVTFYRDLQRQTLKDVYTISGNPPDYTFTDVGAVLTLGINGTFVDENGDPFVPYAYPYDADGNIDLYYVTVVNSGGVPQFTREAVPYVNSSGITPSTDIGNNENQLSNPQFVEVDIPSTSQVVLNVTGSNTVTPIAPGWDFVTSGSGTITVQRLQPTAVNIPTNPPYILSITASAGLGSSIILRQRLYNSPTLFQGSFASGSFIAAVLAGGTSNISMIYAPNTGTPTTIIASTSIPTDGAYHLVQGNAAIPQQINTPADQGYVDIEYIIPTSVTIGISSLQLVGTSTAINIGFDAQTAARQKDHLFHYYEYSLVYEPKNSFLTGWNFPLNPWQFTTTTVTNVTGNQYTADQTIIIQQAYVSNISNTNNIAVGQSTFTDNYNLQINAVTATNQFAIVQYIDAATVASLWQKTLSSLVKAYIKTTNSSQISMKMRLFYNASLPNVVSQTDPVSSWTAGSDPVFATGYTAIVPENDPVIILVNNMEVAFPFNKFVLPASTSDNMTLGIMLYTTANMSITGTPDQIFITDVSLVRNDFAIATQPQTFNQVLQDCQYYYEKSYDQYVLPATKTSNGNLTAPMNVSDDGTNVYGSAISFGLSFNTVKRVPMTSNRLTMYSITDTNPTVTANTVRALAYTNGLLRGASNATFNFFWTPIFATKNILFTGVVGSTKIVTAPDGGSSTNMFSSISYHFTADARIGVTN
jgi:hypothetical protein